MVLESAIPLPFYSENWLDIVSDSRMMEMLLMLCKAEYREAMWRATPALIKRIEREEFGLRSSIVDIIAAALAGPGEW